MERPRQPEVTAQGSIWEDKYSNLPVFCQGGFPVAKPSEVKAG